MNEVNVKAAYASWNREQRLRQMWVRKLRSISQDIESLRLDMESSWSGGDARTAEMLRTNPRYLKTVNAFLNLRGYRKCMDGWKLACGSDVGLYKKTSRLGWPRLWRVLLKTRKPNREEIP